MSPRPFLPKYFSPFLTHPTIPLHFRSPLPSSTPLINNYSTQFDNPKLWVKSPAPDIQPIGAKTIPEFVWEKVLQWDNLPAFICGTTSKIYKYSDVYRDSRGFGAGLIKLGFERGSVIGVVLPNMPEFVISVLGSMDAGLLVSTINPGYTPHEITRQLLNSEAKYVVTIPQFLPSVLKAREFCPELEKIILIGPSTPEGLLNYSELIKTDPAGVDFLRGTEIDTTTTVALLPYSSGTTGAPKGVCLTHSNLTTNTRQRSQPGVGSSKTPNERNGEQERFIGLLPFFHIAGFNVAHLLSLHQGAYTLCLPKFDPAGFVKAMRTHRPTILQTAPPLISFMCQSPDIGVKELETVHTVTGGSAPIGQALITQFLDKSGKYIFFQEAYGMTETSPVTHMLMPGTKNTKIGSIGTPIPNTISKVVDVGTGQTLGPHQNGELCSKGPQVMKEYFKNEKATRDTIDPQGWLHTGDIAYYDEDGCFYIVDRLKELIKVKGFQVAPSELEDLLREHQSIVDVAVIGVPDSAAGELPRAYIVRRNDRLTEEEVNEFLKDKIISYKRLKGGIQFIETIPKAPSGKILRRVILEEYKKSKGI